MNENASPLIAILTLYLRAVGALAQGLVPLVVLACTFVQKLQEQCPEAFDETGNLRPNWQEIVTAKGSVPIPHAAALKIDTSAATRHIPIFLN